MTTTNPQDAHLYINEDFPSPPPPPSNVIPVDETNASLATSTGTAANNAPTNISTPPSIKVTSVDETKIIQPESTNIATVNKPINLQATSSNKSADPPLNFGAIPADTVTAAEDTTDPKLSEDAALMDSLKKLEDTINDPKTQQTFKQAAVFAILCGSVCTLITLGIVAIIPLLKLIIGWRYSDECTVNWRIPHYLVVAGVVELSIIGLNVLNIALTMSGVFKADNRSRVGKYLTKGNSALLTVLNIFILGWFIAGCVWIFGAWGKVQYKNPDQSNYCVSTLYRFAYWLLFFSIIYHLITCCSTCSKFCSQSGNKKKSKATSAPTSEA